MIKYNFIASCYGLNIQTTLNRGTKIYEDIRLSNNSKQVQTLFASPFKNVIGSLEYEQLHKAPYFYANGALENDIVFEDDNVGLEKLSDFIKRVQVFTNVLWLVKDHSINTEMCFIEYQRDKQNDKEVKWSSNSRTSIYLNSHCKRVDTIFSINEIKKGLDYFSTLSEDVDSFKDENNQTTYKAKRVERMFYFLQAARNQSYIPNRISVFVTLLETLLSTTNIEVTHKLKERMAWLLGDSFEQRKEIFKTMGDIYSVRSANVHGNKMPKKGDSTEKLEVLSQKIEEYTRQLIIKILTEKEIKAIYDENNDNKIDSWLEEVCLGKES